MTLDDLVTKLLFERMSKDEARLVCDVEEGHITAAKAYAQIIRLRDLEAAELMRERKSWDLAVVFNEYFASLPLDEVKKEAKRWRHHIGCCARERLPRKWFR